MINPIILREHICLRWEKNFVHIVSLKTLDPYISHLFRSGDSMTYLVAA